MRTLSIEDDKSKDGKGRQFRANLMGYITADFLWEGGQADTQHIRPVYATLAGTEASLRPFLANIRKGRKADIRKETTYRQETDGRLELLKTAGYEYIWQRGEKVALLTAYLPDLFQLDPGMIDHEIMGFLSAVPGWWANTQAAKLPAAEVGRVRRHLAKLGDTYSEEETRQLIPIAAHFAAMLDKRTRRPLINDLAFSVQLYTSALKHNVARQPKEPSSRYTHPSARAGFEVYGVGALGFAALTAVNVTQRVIDDLLAMNIKEWRKQ
jgi:hypothetical protein